MNISIVGHVCIDKNTSENSSYTSAGSPAMYIHKIYKQLPDNQVTIIAPYGVDFLAYKSDARLYPEKPVDEKTLLYENIIKDGSRVQKAHNRSFANPIPVDTKMEEMLASSDIVIITPLLPNYPPEYVRNLLFHTKKHALKVLLPQGYYRGFDADDTVHVRSFHEADSILPFVDIVIVSEQDHSNMLAISKKWAKKYNTIIIVTLGEKGAVAVTREKNIRLQTKAIPEHEIVNPVGSGDIFSAGFAYRYQLIHDVKEAGRFANELARQCLFYTPNNIKIDYQNLV